MGQKKNLGLIVLNSTMMTHLETLEWLVVGASLEIAKGVE